jgi:osmoprotectant transport system substrate-binding protein
LISRYRFLQLEDDRRYFPPYDAVPVVRQSTLDKHPALRGILAGLGGILTVDEMRKLNYSVDGEKRTVKDVVREFLAQKGFSG